MGQNALFNVSKAMQENKKEELKKHIESLEALSNKDWNIEQTIFIYHYYFGTEESFSNAADYLKKKAELTNYDLKGYPLYFFCTGQKEMGYKSLRREIENGSISLMGAHRLIILNGMSSRMRSVISQFMAIIIDLSREAARSKG